MWRMQPEHLGVGVGWKPKEALHPRPQPHGQGGAPPASHVTWGPMHRAGPWRKGALRDFVGTTKDVSSGSSSKLSPVEGCGKAGSQGLGGGCHGTPAASCLASFQASHWSRAPGPWPSLCKQLAQRPEEVRTRRPLLSSGPMRGP